MGSFLARVLVGGGVFLGGVPLGFALRAGVAPDAPDLLAFSFFPLLYVTAMAAWGVAAGGALLVRVVRGRPVEQPGESVREGGDPEEAVQFPPGTWAIVAACASGGTVGGFVLGLWSSHTLRATAIGLVAGALYGVVLWLLARARLLAWLD